MEIVTDMLSLINQSDPEENTTSLSWVLFRTSNRVFFAKEPYFPRALKEDCLLTSCVSDCVTYECIFLMPS